MVVLCSVIQGVAMDRTKCALAPYQLQLKHTRGRQCAVPDAIASHSPQLCPLLECPALQLQLFAVAIFEGGSDHHMADSHKLGLHVFFHGRRILRLHNLGNKKSLDSDHRCGSLE